MTITDEMVERAARAPKHSIGGWAGHWNICAFARDREPVVVEVVSGTYDEALDRQAWHNARAALEAALSAPPSKKEGKG